MDLRALRERLSQPGNELQAWSRDCSAKVTSQLDRWAAHFVPDNAAIAGRRSSSEAEALTATAPASSSVGSPQRLSKLDLKALNPSLSSIGLETVQMLMPRYHAKAGLACERMQHLGMTIEMIRHVMRAIWSIPAGAGEQSESELRDVFRMLDTTGDGTLDEDEFLAVLPLLGETVPPEVRLDRTALALDSPLVTPLACDDISPQALSRLFELADGDRGRTLDAAEFVRFVRQANPADKVSSAFLLIPCDSFQRSGSFSGQPRPIGIHQQPRALARVAIASAPHGPDAVARVLPSQAAPEGWRAFLPEAAAHFEEMVLLHLAEGPARAEGRMRGGEGGKQWRVVPLEELEFVQRSAAQPWSTSIVIPRVDVSNAEAMIAGRPLRGHI